MQFIVKTADQKILVWYQGSDCGKGWFVGESFLHSIFIENWIDRKQQMSYTENSEAVQKEKKGLINYADTVVSGTYDKGTPCYAGGSEIS